MTQSAGELQPRSFGQFLVPFSGKRLFLEFSFGLNDDAEELVAETFLWLDWTLVIGTR